MRKLVLIAGLFNISTFIGFAQQTSSLPDGKKIFETHCSRCHGTDGKLGRFGAKNLQQSNLNDGEYFSIISNGKSIMPKWKKKLSETEITAVIKYVKSFRK